MIGTEAQTSGSKIAIILAIIAMVGGWGTALITNWGSFFPPPPPKAPLPATAQGWATDVIQYQGNPAAAVARSVNDKCAPRDPSGITGVILMNADFKWTIVVWCRMDKSDKKWRGTTLDTTANWNQTIADSLTLGVQAIVGVIRGFGGNTVILLRND